MIARSPHTIPGGLSAQATRCVPILLPARALICAPTSRRCSTWARLVGQGLRSLGQGDIGGPVSRQQSSATARCVWLASPSAVLLSAFPCTVRGRGRRSTASSWGWPAWRARAVRSCGLSRMCSRGRACPGTVTVHRGPGARSPASQCVVFFATTATGSVSGGPWFDCMRGRCRIARAPACRQAAA